MESETESYRNELLKRASAGCEDSLAMLLEQSRDRLLIRIQILLSNKPIKGQSDQDLSSDVMHKAFLKFGSGAFPNLSAFDGWLFRIAKTTHIDARRKEAVRRQVDDIACVDRMSDNSPRSMFDRADSRLHSPSSIAIENENRERLRAAIDDLSFSKKEAVSNYLAGFSGKSIAAIMGRTPNAIKNLLRKAREQIADKVNDRR